MALIQRNSDKLYLINSNMEFGNKKQAFAQRYRFPVDQAVNYAQKLRAKGHDVKAVTDHGQDCEPQQQNFTPVNQEIDYGYCGWRIDVQRVPSGYIHRWVDSDTRQPLQIIESTPQRVFEKLRDMQDTFSERHIAELPRVAPPVVQGLPPQETPREPLRGLRPGDARNFANVEPERRSFYNPNAEAQAAAVQPQVQFEQWERGASVAQLKARYAVDQAFARWYDGVGIPGNNR
jgi:hypothetical protein